MGVLRYILAPYKKGSKGTCPSCSKPRCFRYWFDLKTQTYLSHEYGICDREAKCGHQLSPYKVKPNNESIFLDHDSIRSEHKTLPHAEKFNVVPKTLIDKSLTRQFEDKLSTFLIKKFGEQKSKTVLSEYLVGCSNDFNGDSTVFWQLDANGLLRTGKIMQYDSNGHRTKTEIPQFTWIHKRFKGDFILKQCWFGEHLLAKYPNKDIMVVESEKTAIIMAIVRPQYVWLASCIENGLSHYKLKTLDGRNVTLIPDKNSFVKWQKKATEYLDNKIIVSRFVEDLESLSDGDDIADYILVLKK